MEDYIMVAEDNLVMLSNGTTVNDERLNPSDTVLGWDGNKFVSSNITKIELSNPEFVYAVEVGNKTVTVAKENGFWLDGGVEIFADKLTPGVSKVYVKDGENLKLEIVTDVTRLYNEKTVYTVCGTTYRNFISNGILLHNFDLNDYVTSSVIGNGSKRLPLYENWTGGADYEDGLTTFRATHDAYLKAMFEVILASGALLRDGEPGSYNYRGAGWKVKEGSNDAKKFIQLYELWASSSAILWNYMEKSKLHFSTLDQINEYFSEGKLQLKEESWSIASGSVPNDYSPSESFDAKEYVKRGYLWADDISKALGERDVEYILGDADKVLDTDTYFSTLNRLITNFQNASADLLSSLGCIGTGKISARFSDNLSQGRRISDSTYPLNSEGNTTSPWTYEEEA